MPRRDVNVKDKGAGRPSGYRPIGEAFLYRSAIWKVKGLYLSSSPSGGRDMWWILGQQPHDESDTEEGT